MKINTLAQLSKAVSEKKAVICPMLEAFGKPKPAVFVLNMSGQMILRMILVGLYTYKKKGS